MRGICCTLTLALLVFTGCKKEAPPPAPATAEEPESADSDEESKEEAPKKEASPTAEPTKDGEYRVEAVVTKVAAEWFPKEEAKDKAWLRTKVESDAGAVDGKVRIKLYKPGADLEESKPLHSGWSDRYLKVPAGTYDVLVAYQESSLARASGWIRGVKLEQGKLLRLRVSVDYAVGRVRIKPSSQEQDVSSKTRVAVYKAGADKEESKPLITFWAGRETVLPAGKVDLLLTYEESSLVRVEHWLRGVEVPAKRALLKKPVTLVLAFSRVKVKVTNLGEDLGGKVRLRFYKAGADPESDKEVLGSWSGRSLPLPAGSYDLKLSYDLPHAKKSLWKKAVALSGKRDLVKVEADMKFPLGQLEVTASQGGKPLGGARVEVFAVGKKDKPLAASWTGRKVQLEAGTYDVKVSHKGKSAWTKGVKLKHGASEKRAVPLPK